jgi:hypothetical protein
MAYALLVKLLQLLPASQYPGAAKLLPAPTRIDVIDESCDPEFPGQADDIRNNPGMSGCPPDHQWRM